MTPTATRETSRVDQRVDQRRNYALHLLGGGFLFIGLEFGNMRLVVPWIDTQLGVAYFLVALIVPVLQFGLIAAQLGAAPLIARAALRKQPVVGFCLVLVASLVAIIVAAVTLPPLLAGLALLVCVLCFGTSHGIFNVGYDDLLAKTIPEARRGRLVAHRAALGGALTLVVSLVVLLFLPEVEGNQVLLLWLAVAGWIGVVLAYSALDEPPSPSVRKSFTLRELSRGFGLVRTYPWFKRLLIARTLLLSAELAIPFYAIHAATLYDPTAQNATVFVLATGIGVISSGLIWANSTNRARMAEGALFALIAGVLTLVIDSIEHLQITYFHAFVFVLLTLAEQGSVQGQITYMMDHAPAADRPTLIATANASMRALGIGVALVLGAVGHLHDIRTPLVVLMVFNAAAAIYALRAFES